MFEWLSRMLGAGDIPDPDDVEAQDEANRLRVAYAALDSGRTVFGEVDEAGRLTMRYEDGSPVPDEEIDPEARP